jgi:hypothetical protein
MRRLAARHTGDRAIRILLFAQRRVKSFKFTYETPSFEVHFTDNWTVAEIG